MNNRDDENKRLHDNAILVQVALEGDIEHRAGDLLDKTARGLSEYVNAVLQITAIAMPDNNIRRMLMSLLLAYEERERNES